MSEDVTAVLRADTTEFDDAVDRSAARAKAAAESMATTFRRTAEIGGYLIAITGQAVGQVYHMLGQLGYMALRLFSTIIAGEAAFNPFVAAAETGAIVSLAITIIQIENGQNEAARTTQRLSQGWYLLSLY